jgi:hypothetical protein
MLRYKLRTLLIVLLLAGFVAAAFANDEGLGILTYLTCLVLFVTVCWVRAVQRRALANSEVTGTHYPFDPVFGTLVAICVAFAASVAFCGTCSIAQLPFIEGFMVPLGDEGQQRLARSRFDRGLLISMPLGTIALLFVYWLFWPPVRKQVSCGEGRKQIT